MTTPMFVAFLRVTEVLRPAFDPRIYRRLLVILIGWIRTTGRHAITEALVVTGVAGVREHSGFHRVFSTARWDLDTVSQLLVAALVARLGDGPVRAVVDDTLAPHKGPQIFGLGCHLDAVHATRRTKVFRFGHVWVVLSLLVHLPFARRPWALPVAFRLYRNVADCARHGVDHRTKTALAHELVTLLATWIPDRRLEVTADEAYSNGPVLRGLDARVVWFGALRLNAVLTAPPPAGATVGARLPTPAALATTDAVPWQYTRVPLYGRARRRAYKTCVAQWRGALGDAVLRVVVVHCTTGDRPTRAFFCTDPRVHVPPLLVGYSARWPTEPMFRDTKQLLGFAQSSARTPQAVQRTAPMMALLVSLLTLWFHDAQLAGTAGVIPLRPWYRTKRGISFADVLRAAQTHLGRVDLAIELPRLDSMVPRARRRKFPGQLPLPFAA